MQQSEKTTRKPMQKKQRPKKKWSEFTPTEQRLMVVGGLVQLTLMVSAQRDISKRPAEAIRGPKWLWRLVSMINFVGPVAYFAVGRRRPGTDSGAPEAEVRRVS